MTKPEASEKPLTASELLIQRPLYIFDLPIEILSTLRLQDTNITTAEETSLKVGHASVENVPVEKSHAQGTSCHLCHAIFASVGDQRQHTRSDFHRYNLKLQVKGFPTVKEAEFNDLIGDLDESISGSDSSDSEPEVETETTLKALLKRQAKIEDPRDEPKPVNASSPFIWFTSSATPQNVSLGVYKGLLSRERSDLVEAMRRKQLAPIQHKTKLESTEGPSYFFCMTGGGHFAAMIVSLVSLIRKGARGFDERHAIIKAHKTFHRYTTRRKQGGSQSANDNAKGAAHSAGASIRRYNEMALEADIRRLLEEWKSMIDQAELLFIRATGIPSRRTLYGPYEGQVIKSSDDRTRSFPFNTRRATQSELLRSFNELTRFKVGSPAPKITPTVKPEKEKKPVVQAPVLSKEEEALQMHSTQIQALIKRSKAPALLSYLKNNDLSSDMTFASGTHSHHTPTPLHYAASINSAAVVLVLLTQAQANPSLLNNDDHTPYDLAGDLKTRNAFRTARHTLGESLDWKAAHVPSALSAAEAEARLSENDSTQRDAEMKRRQADLEKINEQEEAQKVKGIEKRVGKGKSLGGMGLEKTGAERREEESRGLTPELRARLERERRARAAEERLKRME